MTSWIRPCLILQSQAKCEKKFQETIKKTVLNQCNFTGKITRKNTTLVSHN